MTLWVAGCVPTSTEPAAPTAVQPSGPTPAGDLVPALPKQERLPTPTVKITLSVSADGQVAQTAYAVQTTRELYLRATLAGLSGQRLVTLKVFSPSGAKYDELHAVLTDQPGGPSRVRLDVGPPQGLELLHHAPMDRALAELVLPVAGTFITQHSLTGTWTVSAHLDGEEAARAVTSFVLQ